MGRIVLGFVAGCLLSLLIQPVFVTVVAAIVVFAWAIVVLVKHAPKGSVDLKDDTGGMAEVPDFGDE